MTRRPLVVAGDCLLDVDVDGSAARLCPDAPVPVVDQAHERSRPGGAGLAAALAAGDGRAVTLVTALGRDAAADVLRARLESFGVEVIDLGLDGGTSEKVRVRCDGRTLLRLDRGGAGGAIGPVTADALRALGAAGAVLVADYGRGMSRIPELREALAGMGSRVPVVWDPHPRGDTPVPNVRLATPNRDEAARFAEGVRGDGLPAQTARAQLLARRWRASGVAVTLGAAGALLAAADGVPLMIPARPVRGGDTCGAGDRFASAAACLLADGASPAEAVAGAVACASAFVAAGGAAAVDTGRTLRGLATRPLSGLRAAQDVIARARAAGGTVVAAGGCFDLLHAGHVSMLESARQLGACLVVCLNSDASVRRLKGAGRPMVREADRAAVLAGLRCVDAVVSFDEDTPEALLSRLRPDIFAKGGDYTVAALPERGLLESWGGQAVILPYLEGRSTSTLVEEAVRRAAG
ncbi:MAG TPA: D-glycero-beta-D-manno-heptose 1-phosphate adenylyltransferase [Candidatus Dormibacteraeota bacterium]|jgi:rfaE bifunctional protein nucleotidyltransferase chain/domain|nr:D-glycero-beta-D-manno-heptose 1-phosphate adenylyltransferase [Candidatus Dormibacteraeota bacterium]